MFGKNYDLDINHLNNEIKTYDKNVGMLNKNIGHLKEIIDSLQESMIGLAKVQAQHKQFIQFFVNHGTVDADAQEDLMKMIREMADIDKIASKGKKKKGA